MSNDPCLCLKGFRLQRVSSILSYRGTDELSKTVRVRVRFGLSKVRIIVRPILCLSRGFNFVDYFFLFIFTSFIVETRIPQSFV